MQVFKIFGILLAIFRLLLLLLALFLVVGIGILLKWMKLLPVKFAFLIRTYWCKLALFILGIRIHCSTKPYLSPGTLYVSNHRSLIDAVIVFSFINNGYAVSKAEVRDYPIIGSGADLSGVVYINRSDKLSRNSTKIAIADALKNNLSVTIFPEGTISITRELLGYKKGAFEGAVETNSPIVAIALEYSNPKKDFWFSNHLLKQFIVTFSKVRTSVRVFFFDPVQGKDAIELCNQIQFKTQQKVFEYQNDWLPKNVPDSFGKKV